MMLASLENIMWNCHISKKVMTIWSRVIVTFLQKKKKIKYYLHIDWMVEKKIDISMFLMKNPRNFHLLYVIALFGAQKKCFANHSRRPNVNILFVKCKKVSFIFTEKSVMISCSKFSFAKCWKGRRTKKNNNHDLFFLLFLFAASTANTL